MDSPDDAVRAIFQRAERFFEARVAALVDAKAMRAAAAGNPPPAARKALRDARTTAGREKLDVLVRRLADLAVARARAAGDEPHVATALTGSALAVVACAVMTAAQQRAQEAEAEAEAAAAASTAPPGLSIGTTWSITSSLSSSVLGGDDEEDQKCDEKLTAGQHEHLCSKDSTAYRRDGTHRHLNGSSYLNHTADDDADDGYGICARQVVESVLSGSGACDDDPDEGVNLTNSPVCEHDRVYAPARDVESLDRSQGDHRFLDPRLLGPAALPSAQPDCYASPEHGGHRFDIRFNTMDWPPLTTVPTGRAGSLPASTSSLSSSPSPSTSPITSPSQVNYSGRKGEATRWGSPGLSPIVHLNVNRALEEEKWQRAEQEKTNAWMMRTRRWS